MQRIDPGSLLRHDLLLLPGDLLSDLSFHSACIGHLFTVLFGFDLQLPHELELFHINLTVTGTFHGEKLLKWHDFLPCIALFCCLLKTRLS